MQQFDQIELLNSLTAAFIQGKEHENVDHPLFNHPDLVVFIILRKKGRKISEAWVDQKNGINAFQSALDLAWSRLPITTEPDVIELNVAYEFELIDAAKRSHAFSNIRRGINGIELRYRDKIEFQTPTQAISSNRSFAKIVDKFADENNLTEFQVAKELQTRRFSAEQFIIRLDDTPSTTKMYRGNILVPIDKISQAEVAAFAHRLSGWMVRNVNDEGRMTYKYWPSNGRESSANNMIRQWMATLCLVRIAAFYEQPSVYRLARRNIEYNIEHFYRMIGDRGYIEYEDKAKLGAAAIAALAMFEHPERNDFLTYQNALTNTINDLRSENGYFRTFVKPKGRNDNQNFYPGEALVFLSSLYKESGEPALRNQIYTSMKFYRNWHLENRNPAFVPWHTMAYANVWEVTKDPELRDWIFEMNDWLLSMQPENVSSFADIEGRFYDPDRAYFGPPHASATGVYMEGLIQAFKIAKDVGDTERAERYRLSLLRAIRSLMQLEFKDDIDMFYISKRHNVRGGLRTTVYNNEIRVDNIQHGLMALIHILQTFEPSEFQYSK